MESAFLFNITNLAFYNILYSTKIQEKKVFCLTFPHNAVCLLDIVKEAACDFNNVNVGM